jgi:hypothetical protein
MSSLDRFYARYAEVGLGEEIGGPPIAYCPEIEARSLQLIAKAQALRNAPPRRGRGTAHRWRDLMQETVDLMILHGTPLPVIMAAALLWDKKGIGPLVNESELERESAWLSAMIFDAEHPGASENAVAGVVARKLGGKAEQYRTQVRKRRKEADWKWRVELFRNPMASFPNPLAK